MSVVPTANPAASRLPLLIKLAWVCALLPFLTTHTSYLIAASQGHVEWCIPYWDACTSISATGRQMPEKLWFKLGMIPSALVTMLFWRQLAQWFAGSAISEQQRWFAAMQATGILAGVFLVGYTLALGEEGDTFRFIRRTGVILAFALTYLAQLLSTHLLGQYARELSNPKLNLHQQRLMTLLLSLLGVGIVSVMLQGLLGDNYDRYEDGFEWIMALMLNLWFAGTARLLSRIHKMV